MEPKDLKNPDGLKSTAKDTDSAKDEKMKKEENQKISKSSEKNEKQEKPKPDEKVEKVAVNEASEEKKEVDAPKQKSDEKPEIETQTELSEDKKVAKAKVKASKTSESSEEKKEADAPKEKENEKKAEISSDNKEVEAEEKTSESSEEKKEVDAPKKKVDEKKAEISSDNKEAEAEEKTSESSELDEQKKSEAPGEKEKADTPEETAPENNVKKEGQKEDIEKKEQSSSDKKEKTTDKQEKKNEPVKEKPDYNQFNQVELVNAMRDLLKEGDFYAIRDEIEAIKAAFYKQVKDENEQKEKEFIEAGGNEEEFETEENPYEKDIKDLLLKYRQLRSEHNKNLEEEKEINLQAKYDVIEEIKGLINKEESINKTFHEFRDLQQRWREIGLVPQAKMKDLWETYHFHVENFYDYIKINKELRDLDLKKNLEIKIKLCEQAEELLLEPNIVKAFNALQKLHERWREGGPVPRENKDDIWERFKASTSKINKKHQEYYENRKADQKKNLEAKRALCEQVEEINELELNTHKEWGEKSNEVKNLQKVWRTIGFAPRKDNNKIYDRFRKACDTFFDTKRDFYSKNKELQQNNLQLKIDLCVQAEALKDSTDWRKTTQDLINIQKQWKDIGPVPRKQSDAIWKRFRAACDHFFNQKSEHFSNIDSEQVENLKLKEQLIKDVQNFEPKDDADENLQALKDFQRRWTEIGHVPIRKKDAVQRDYRDAINKLFDELKLDESKRNLLKFRTKMASFSESSRGQNKMRFERDKYINKMKQLENDLVLLDNNVGFFAKSKNAESLIEDVKRKIEQTKEKIEMLKEKIRVIDEMDQSDE